MKNTRILSGMTGLVLLAVLVFAGCDTNGDDGGAPTTGSVSVVNLSDSLSPGSIVLTNINTQWTTKNSKELAYSNTPDYQMDDNRIKEWHIGDLAPGKYKLEIAFSKLGILDSGEFEITAGVTRTAQIIYDYDSLPTHHRIQISGQATTTSGGSVSVVYLSNEYRSISRDLIILTNTDTTWTASNSVTLYSTTSSGSPKEWRNDNLPPGKYKVEINFIGKNTGIVSSGEFDVNAGVTRIVQCIFTANSDSSAGNAGFTNHRIEVK